MTAVMREEGPDVMETATTRVAEVTAVAASVMTTIIAETVKGRTQLAEAGGIKSHRTALHHLPLAKVAVVAEAAGRGLNPQVAEKSRTHVAG